jgi:tRNA (adenine57-N1/adenine58-N1)-methyltransferase
MYETLLRPHEVAQVPQPQSIKDVSEKLKDAEKRREEKRLRQIANNKARLASVITSTKRKRGDAGDASPENKRVKTEEDADEGVEAEAVLTTVSVQMDMIKADEETEQDLLVADESHMKEITPPSYPSTPPPPTPSRISVSNALPEVRGHTSYLTFAVLVPFSIPDPSGTGVVQPASVSAPPSENAPTTQDTVASTTSSEASPDKSTVLPS